jgi:hypothetical protein
MALSAIQIMMESQRKPAPLKYPKKTYAVFNCFEDELADASEFPEPEDLAVRRYKPPRFNFAH